MKNILIGLFILLLLGASGWLGYYFYEKNQQPPVKFETETPVMGTIVKKTVATGSIVPRREVTIKPRVSGILEKLYVEPGQKVREGDLIARIKVIPNMASLNNAESTLRRAEINRDNARREMERQKGLLAQKVISEQEYVRFKLDHDLAEEAVNAANENLRIIREGATKDAGISTTLVRSTVTGMILDTPFKEGSSVIESNTFNEGTTIAVVADMGQMIFQGKIDESEVGKLRAGMPLVLTVGAIENVAFDATLDYISPKGVTEEGTIKFEIKASILLKDNQFLRAGYSANADIVLDRRDSVMTLPEGLITFGKDSVYVEIEKAPQVFEKRLIKTGLSDGLKIEVTEGLGLQDKVKKK